MVPQVDDQSVGANVTSAMSRDTYSHASLQTATLPRRQRAGKEKHPGARGGGENYPQVVPTLISRPTVVEAAGNKPKLIREYVGRVNSDTSAISIAVMQSPVGWIEPC